MRQFGWPTLVKTAAITAVITSGLWVSAGLVWYHRHVQAEGRSGGGAVVDAALVPASASVAAPPSAPDPGRLVIPVEGVAARELIDTFTQSRADGRVHDAIDIMAPRGTPVIAAAPGTVEKLFFSAQGGITAYLRSPDRRLIYYYAHLDSYAPGLAEGQALSLGAPIGRVGFSGNASPDAPHLHFAIQATTPDRKWYQPSTAINPYPLLVRAGR